MRTHSSKGNDGFTLIEVLIAIAILMVGIMAVMQLFPKSLRQSRIAAERTAAATLASSQLSQLRVMNNPALIQTWIANNTSQTLTSIDRINSLYQGWTTSVQRVTENGDTLRVTFTVKMQDGRSETFVTYVTNP
jgi:type IV pilus modification protein PilV